MQRWEQIPDGALVQLVFPSQEKEIIRAAEQIYRGFAMACGRWKFPLVGGDISAGRQWVLGITLGRAVREECEEERRFKGIVSG